MTRQPDPAAEDYLTIPEAGALFGKKATAAADMVREKKIPTVKIGRQRFVLRSVLDEIMREEIRQQLAARVAETTENVAVRPVILRASTVLGGPKREKKRAA